MLAAGVSFKRLMKPYMLSAALIAVVNYILISSVIPHGTVTRQEFEAKYKNSTRVTSASNVQLMVGPGIIAYIQSYDNRTKTGYGFSLDKFENKKLVSHMTASTIRYDSISDTRFHWKANNYKIRKLKGLREEITTGAMIDTIIHMEPMDLVFSKGQQETLTSSELRQYISKQTERGSSGVSLSSRKRKGGMGLYLGIGLALSFSYILLQTVSATFAINADTPPMLAAWIPNLLYSVIAYFCYRQAPN